MFRFTGGAWLDIRGPFREMAASGERQVARIEPKSYGYGDSPPRPHRPLRGVERRASRSAGDPARARYFVQADVRGIPAHAPPDRRTCNGEVLLRRAWA